jgi:hypothetical protein
LKFGPEINYKHAYKLCTKLFFNASKKIEIGGSCRGYGGEESRCRVLVGKLEGQYHLEYPSVDGSIIIRWTFRKSDVGLWAGSSGPRIGTGGGHW